MKIGAVILAAGFGTRLAPLTDTTPKPLLVVGDRPVATHLHDRLQELEHLTSMVVVVNGKHADQWHSWTDSVLDAPLVVSNGVTNNADRVGAVADLAVAVESIQDCDWIVVVAGDNLLDEPLQVHVDAAVERDTPVVLCRDLGADVPAGRFGEVTTDDDGLVFKFREKPANPHSPLAATCTYVLPGDIGSDLAVYLTNGDADSPGTFIGWLANRRPVQARTLTGRYFDIGNHETLALARAAFSA